MKISDIKTILPTLDSIRFTLPNGDMVPAHFHVTEVGIVERKFIDCGGVLRHQNKVNFQLWTADDFDHRLSVEKFSKILDMSEHTLGNMDDWDIEIEYQQSTISRFALDFKQGAFGLVALNTDCLAKDKCGITPDTSSNTCQPKTSGECC